MALDQKRLQKKKAKKSAKDKARHTKSKRLTLSLEADDYAQKMRAVKFPIHECWMTENLFNVGMGNVIISRKLDSSDILLGLFLVDSYCLGIKNVVFELVTEFNYQKNIARLERESGLTPCSPSCARKLVEGAKAFAGDLGLPPHRDYIKARKIFGDIDTTECSDTHNFGQDGKPFYISGPNDSLAFQKKVVRTLSGKIKGGEANYLVESNERK